MAVGHLTDEPWVANESQLLSDRDKVWVVRADRAYHTSSRCSAIEASPSGDEPEPQRIMKAMAAQAGYTMCRWCRAWLEA